MKAGQDLDILVATRVLGHTLHKQDDAYVETTPKGTRPLPHYSRSIKAAWEVVQAMGITLIPIQENSWFALVGPKVGWASPAEFMECMQKGEFLRAGAAVSESAPLSICIAAFNAIEKRNSDELETPHRELN
jgi:hypothetical protein